MNILFLANHLNPGGISSYLFTLSSGLKAKGHRIYLASGGGEWEEKFLEKGIHLIKAPLKTKSELSPKLLVSLFKLIPRIKKEKIEIIHANTRVTQVLAFWLSRFCGLPYLSTCHGFFRPHLFRKVFPRWGKMVIAISDSVKEHLMRDLKVRPQDIRLIYNGIDVSKFQANTSIEKSAFGLKDIPVVGIIGRLSSVKGHAYLIQAFSKVLSQGINAQLLIVGEGDCFSKLQDLIRSLKIEEKVYFLPSLKQTNEVLSVMDIFVMPSLQEGMGLSLMEAMAAGCAVIASDIGGIRDLMKNGYHGILVKPADVQGLAQAIIELLKDAQKRKFLGQNAVQRIKENFTQEKMVNQTEEVFLECLKK